METFSSVAQNREELHLSVDVSQSEAPLFTWKGVGDLTFLRSLAKIREASKSWNSIEDAKTEIQNWSGNSSFELMLREVIGKATGEWELPFSEDELCHCRVVPTDIVNSAIIGGAHSTSKVSAQTNASTQCGTCRPDVEKILNYRLKLPSA